MDIEISIRGESKVGLISVAGELSGASVDKFRTHVAALLSPRKNVRHYVIDLTHVDFIDSAGLGSLIAILKRIRDLKGDVKLACLQSGPRSVFEVTRTDKFFDIYDTLNEAMSSF